MTVASTYFFLLHVNTLLFLRRRDAFLSETKEPALRNIDVFLSQHAANERLSRPPNPLQPRWKAKKPG
jgi:hypothetical protein